MGANTYPIEEWVITEEKFLKEWNYRNETTFALSNGYIGTRGTFDEGYPFTVDEGLEGNFINGFYESEHIMYGEWNFGFPEKSQSLLNLPDLKKTKIVIDGDVFDLNQGEIINYNRKLLMKDGVVVRNVTWKSPNGKKVVAEFRRLVSLEKKNIMAIQLKLTPVNFSGKVELTTYLEAGVENHTRKTNPLIDYGPYGKHLAVKELKAEGDYLLHKGKVIHSGLSMACGSLTKCEGVIKNSEVLEEDASLTYELSVEEGKTYVFEKMIAYTCDFDIAEDKMIDFIKDELKKAMDLGYDEMEKLQKKHMDEFWSKADIKVEGDEALQQGEEKSQ